VIESPTIMIRGDGPDGWPDTDADGDGEDGAGRADAETEAVLRPAPAAAWHPVSAMATTASAAAPRRPRWAVPSQRDPGPIILTSSSTMAIANAPPPQG
jgi:hypothetical protein